MATGTPPTLPANLQHRVIINTQWPYVDLMGLRLVSHKFKKTVDGDPSLSKARVLYLVLIHGGLKYADLKRLQATSTGWMETIEMAPQLAGRLFRDFDWTGSGNLKEFNMHPLLNFSTSLTVGKGVIMFQATDESRVLFMAGKSNDGELLNLLDHPCLDELATFPPSRKIKVTACDVTPIFGGTDFFIEDDDYLSVGEVIFAISAWWATHFTYDQEEDYDVYPDGYEPETPFHFVTQAWMEVDKKEKIPRYMFIFDG